DPERGQGGDDTRLQVPQEAVYVAAATLEIDDRVADELPRAVIRDVAAAADAHQRRDSGTRTAARERTQILDATAATGGEHRIVLEEQELIAEHVVRARELFLQRERLRVVDAPEPARRDRAAGRDRDAGQ